MAGLHLSFHQVRHFESWKDNKDNSVGYGIRIWIRNSELQIRITRWLTHLCMWNPVLGVAAAAAGRSPAWQLGPGVEEDEEKIPILSTGSLFSEQPCFRSILSLRFLWKGLPLRDIKATRVALIPRRGHPPVLIPWPVRVGWLQWPSGRHHPDKGERHR